MTKLLFLDIDGVLNAHAPIDPDVGSATLDRCKVELLNGVLKTTGAKVVISSAWRYLVHRRDMTIDGLDWLLRSHGLLAGRIAGITREDVMVSRGDGSTPWPMANERGRQITDWLDVFKHRKGVISRYAAVDDLDLGISEAGHPFVHVDGRVGLTDANVIDLIEILGRQAVSQTA